MSTTTQLRKPEPLSPYEEALIELLPDQGAWSEEAYLIVTDDCNRFVEFTDGYLEILPVPNDQHQAISRFLFVMLNTFLTPIGGVVSFPVLRLQIRKGKFREPDLIALKDAKDDRRQSRFWTGADLVVEILSPGGEQRDRIRKRADYVEGKVLEYWIVDPKTEKIEILALAGKRYRRTGIFGRGKEATSLAFPGFAVKVGDVFDAR